MRDNERLSETTVSAIPLERVRFSGLRQSLAPDDKQAEFVSEDKLLTGEISACIFRLGCYLVRSAQRVYRISSEEVYFPEKESPASNEETEIVRKDLASNIADANLGVTRTGIVPPSWYNKLRVTHEISAKHIDAPGETFQYICRAASARNYSWSEGIKEITCEKAEPGIPDEYASLVVCLGWTGSSYSMDTFYRLEPTGKVTEDTVRPF